LFIGVFSVPAARIAAAADARKAETSVPGTGAVAFDGRFEGRMETGGRLTESVNPDL